jgi:hypothetical protein
VAADRVPDAVDNPSDEELRACRPGISDPLPKEKFSSPSWGGDHEKVTERLKGEGH